MNKLFFFRVFVFVIVEILLNIAVVNGQANYTEKEKNALKKFRNLVEGSMTQDYQKLDSYLIRWLRANNFDVSAANKGFRKNAKWRQENNMDSILNKTILALNPPIYSINGVDYEGRPVITFTPTRVDLRGLIVSGNGENLVRYWDQILEEGEHKLETVSNETEGRIFQGIALLDLQRFNIRQHTCLRCVSMFLDWIRHYENYHPDMAKEMIIINVPRAFIPIQHLAGPILSPGTRKIFKLFSTDRKEWSAYLQQIIPPDQLTFQFGGKNPN